MLSRIDIASREELAATANSVAEVRDEIDADSLAYVSVDGLVEALGRDADELCLGCVEGAYPYDVADEECARDVTRPTIGEP